ncbi:HNH endonuclease signature motif containing protein [Corynebacterium halotolerans]|nr:HNH endonuclease signature motif containing protein [Corynebacterium halotolerans]
MGAAEDIARCVDQIEAGLAGLAGHLVDPSAVAFDEIREHFERLEQVVAGKSYLDAAFAFIAQEADAGRRVGSTKVVDYLTKRLGLSTAEAWSRVSQARSLFTPPEPPKPEPVEGSESEGERVARERAEREAQERARREREAQERMREKLRKEKAAAERLKLIERELEQLSLHAVPGRHVIYEQALEESRRRSPEDLRAWVRERVRHANAAGRRPDGARDLFAALRKRRIRFSRPDADGGVAFSGYLPADSAAKLKVALDPARKPEHLASVPPEEDKRTLDQRRADQLDHILTGYLSGEGARPGGIGSIVVSTTIDDLDSLSLDSRFPTNTGDLLNPLELLRLGAAGTDYLCLFDKDAVVPLAMGRARRTATLEQRIALLAAELVCTDPGCDRPETDCDAHHLVPWVQGGRTDVENLTLRCRKHHGNNNDARDGSGGMGHAERDPVTGRVGHRWAGAADVEVNDTVAQQRSAADKLRRRGRPGEPPGNRPGESPGDPSARPSGPSSDPPPDEPTLFDRSA